MGKYAVYSFCKLGFFVCLLYFAKVLSKSTRQSIIAVMRNDKEICKVPAFLDENEITKACSELNYPQADETGDYSSPNIALCLVFYDTWYKACNSNQLENVADSSASFTSFIQKFYPGKTKEDKIKFCNNFLKLKFSHAKLKPLLSSPHLNEFMCYDICFKNEEKFNPMCAMLAWSVSIDNSEKKSVPSDGKANELVDNKGAKPSGEMESQIDKMLPGKSTSNLNTKNDSPTISSPQNAAQKAANWTSTETKPVIPVQAEPAKVEKQKSTNNADPVVPNQQSATLTSTGTIHASSPKVSKAENSNESAANHNKNDKMTTSNNNNISNNNNNIHNNDQKQTNDIKTEVNSKTKETINGGNGDTSANDGVKQPAKVVNNDVKTSTISEDTQDHDNSANQEDWNRLDDDKPYEPNDNPDQPLDLAGDQNQNNPEPSEERVIISHYHNIRSDEESHFFTYFTVVSLISVVAYIGYHNKQKILAIVLEGRRSRSSRGRRRPSTANYRKLDCTLEEAVTSQCNANVTHVIY